MNNEELASRLLSFGIAKFGSSHGWQKKMADALGIAPQNLRRYLDGKFVPGNRMRSRLREIGLNIDWLDTGIGSMTDPEEREFRRIMRETITDAGGNVHALAAEPSFSYIPLSVSQPEDVRAIAVPDDSMAGVVWAGDTIFVRKEQGCGLGDLCLVKTAAGSHKIRHVYISDSTVLLTATNAAPESLSISELASVNSVIAATIEGIHLRGK